MNHPIALIQLVSEQTMQNILPAMALDPARICQIVSRRMWPFAPYVENACRLAGLRAEFADEEMNADMPTPDQTRAAVAHAIAEAKTAGLTPVVNVTGGTKLMALGAYLAAREAPCPSFYYDRGQGGWIPLDTAPAIQQPDLDAAARRLSVDILMAAHGKPPDSFRAHPPPGPALRQFAETAYRVGRGDPPDLRAWRDKIGVSFRRNGRVRDSSRQLGEALARPLPPPDGDAARATAEAAVAAGLLRRDAHALFLNARSDRHDVEERLNWLGGGWFEVWVHGRLARAAALADLKWQVEPLAQAQTAGYGETDLLCVDVERAALMLVSCKAAPPRRPGVLEHIESVRQRATNLGGKYCRALLALYSPGGAIPADLVERGKRLNVEVCIGDALVTRLPDRDAAGTAS